LYAAVDILPTGPDGALALVNLQRGTPAIVQLDSAGQNLGVALLPLPSDAPGDATITAASLSKYEGKYLVGGNYYSPSAPTGAAVWLSEDGASWLPVTTSGLAGPVEHVSSSSQGWLAVGQAASPPAPDGRPPQGYVCRSVDGQSWETLLTADDVMFHDVADYDAGLIAVAGGRAAAAYQSADGKAWSAVPLDAGNRPADFSIDLRAIAVEGGRVVVVGRFGEDAGFWSAP
jgi:hypothetical protein